MTYPKRHRLAGLTIQEVSLVDQPANHGAKVLFMKQHEGTDASLDAMAKRLAAENGVSIAKGYDLALATPEGAALYGPGSSVAKGQGGRQTPATVAKASADASLDALARRYASANGVTLATAYCAVMSSPEGMALYDGRATALVDQARETRADQDTLRRIAMRSA